RSHQVLGAQIDEPAENVRIPTQLIKRPDGGMLLTKIDQKAAGYGTILTDRGGSESRRPGVNRSPELLHQRVIQRSVTTPFHVARPGRGLMWCPPGFASC